ncbi:MAG: hypothetical protein SFV81_19825 [Pirellulaceae bacterium]|nr:hypothetical protein [Pirellulaceae bacterium]
MRSSITILSERSNFLRAPRIRHFHALFFHGDAHRNEQWNPLDSRGVNIECEQIDSLTVWCNRFLIPHYCVPGTWPVVSQEVHTRLQNVAGIRFIPIRLGRVVNYPWKVEEPLHIEPGDQDSVDVFKSLPEVDGQDLPVRYEMLTYQHSSVIGHCENVRSVSVETGTQPMSSFQEYNYCSELFKKYPIHRFCGSIVFHRDAWDKI